MTVVYCTTLLVSYWRVHPVERIYNSDSLGLLVSSPIALFSLQNLPKSNSMPVGVTEMPFKHLYLFADTETNDSIGALPHIVGMKRRKQK